MTAGRPLSLQANIRERGIFGCGSLHHVPTLRRRRRLLEAAYTAGFRQFDVAPAYGNGLAERAVGAFAAEAGSDVTIHTKVGIPITLYPAWTDRIFVAARAWDAAFGTHRRVYGQRCFEPATIAQSLADSTARLQGRVPDGFYLHEPLAPFSAEEWAALTRELNQLRDDRRFGFWGVAGPQFAFRLTPFGETVPAVQCPVADWLAASPADRSQVASVSLYGLVRYHTRMQHEISLEGWLCRLAAEYPQAHFVLTTRREDRLAAWTAQ